MCNRITFIEPGNTIKRFHISVGLEEVKKENTWLEKDRTRYGNPYLCMDTHIYVNDFPEFPWYGPRKLPEVVES